MSAALDQSQIFFLNVWDVMTPLQKRIAVAFLYFETGRRSNHIKASFPSRETIAKMARCSVGSVKKFLKNAVGLILYRQLRRFHSSVYRIDPVFFGVVKKLQDLGLLNNWKKHRKWVLEGMQNSEDFIDKRWGEKFELSTTGVAAREGIGVATIKTLIKTSDKSTKKTVLGFAPSAVAVKSSLEKHKKFQVPGLSKATIDKICEASAIAPVIVDLLNEDYEYMIRKEIPIRHPNAWALSHLQSCKKYVATQLMRKNV